MTKPTYHNRHKTRDSSHDLPLRCQATNAHPRASSDLDFVSPSRSPPRWCTHPRGFLKLACRWRSNTVKGWWFFLGCCRCLTSFLFMCGIPPRDSSFFFRSKTTGFSTIVWSFLFRWRSFDFEEADDDVWQRSSEVQERRQEVLRDEISWDVSHWLFSMMIAYGLKIDHDWIISWNGVKILLDRDCNESMFYDDE